MTRQKVGLFIEGNEKLWKFKHQSKKDVLNVKLLNEKVEFMLFVKILDISKDRDKIMARILGLDIKDNKKTFIGLTAIFGVGRSNVNEVLKKAKVDGDKRVKDLTNDEILSLQKVIDEIPTGGALRKIINENIKRLQITGAYRGLRHSMGLPGRGQRTRSNARTRKGKKKTVGSISKSEKSV